MRELLITGGQVIDPASGVDRALDILLRDGRVAQIGELGKLHRSGVEVLKAKGLIVAPGFIDLHVHLREPGQQHKETIATGTAAAAAGGFTSVCAMPNTAPVNDSPEITRWMQEPQRGAVVNVFPIAAATAGSMGVELTDFAALKKAGAVAFTDDGKPILDDRIMSEALAAAAKLRVPVVQHAEDTHLTSGCSMNYGATSFRLGLRGMPNAAESSVVARDIRLASELNAHMHVAHLSTFEALSAVRQAKAHGLRVTAEVTPHHFTLVDDNVGEFDTHYKMNPPLRAVGRSSSADRRSHRRNHRRDCHRSRAARLPRKAGGVRARGVRHHRTGDGSATHAHRSASLFQAAAVAHRGIAVVESCEDFRTRGSRHAGRRLACRRDDLRSQEEVDASTHRSRSRSRAIRRSMAGASPARAVATIVGGNLVHQD